MGIISSICHRRSKYTPKNFPERTYKEEMREFEKADGTKYKRMVRIPWGFVCKVCVRKSKRKWVKEMEHRHGPNWMEKLKQRFQKKQSNEAMDKILRKEGVKKDG